MLVAIRLGTPRLESFGRCAVLRTAQWALDGRSNSTSIDEFRDFLATTATEMVAGARELRAAVGANGPRRPRSTMLNRSAAGLEDDERIRRLARAKLVVTSPPYPGVHVLYHRWQVDGRKEAPLPFMIANKLDGAGSSYYTMGDRKYPELKTYFDNIRATMSSVAALADARTVIVQMVAFSRSVVAAAALSRNDGRGGPDRSVPAGAQGRARRPAMAQRAGPALVQRPARRDAGHRKKSC